MIAENKWGHMSLVRTVTRFGTLLVATTMAVGCGTDDDLVIGAGTGGASTTTAASTTAAAGTGGNSSAPAATGGLSAAGGSSAIIATSSAALATGGATPATGGRASTGGSPPSTGGTTAPATTAPKTFTVSGTVTGLLGAGLGLSLGTGTTPLAIATDGPFTFTQKLTAGAGVNVTVTTQPTSPQQTCTVSGGAITAISSDINNVVVSCTSNKYTIGGTVSGLAGSGLALRNNGSEEITVAADGSFVFPTGVASGQTFAVTISSNPVAPVQTCTVVGGSGTVAAGNVTSVLINCSSNAYSISGTVTGLTGAGLVLQNNAGNDLSVTAAGSFAFSQLVQSGGGYAVTVKSQPTNPSQTCAVTNGSGVVTSSSVDDVAIGCTVNKYLVKAKVTGLTGAGLVLQNNAGDNTEVAADGTVAFPTAVASGSVYQVSVLTQPASQTCAVTEASGTLSDSDVVANVTCVANTYTIGGTLAGYVGSGVTISNGAESLILTAAGPFEFKTALLSGQTYSVTVTTQPATQVSCGVINGGGTVASAKVDNVVVSCPGYTFESSAQGWYVSNQGGANKGTPTWVSTEGSPGAGAISFAVDASNCLDANFIAVVPSWTAFTDTTSMTKMSAWVRFDGALPTTDGSGFVALFANDSSYNGFKSGGWVSPLTGFTLGQWKKVTWTLPDTGIDRTKVIIYGVQLSVGSNATLCQASTILIDSLMFE